MLVVIKSQLWVSENENEVSPPKGKAVNSSKLPAFLNIFQLALQTVEHCMQAH